MTGETTKVSAAAGTGLVLITPAAGQFLMTLEPVPADRGAAPAAGVSEHSPG